MTSIRSKFPCFVLAFILITAASSPLFGLQNEQEQWQGALENGPSKLRIVVKIEQSEGKWIGEAFSPDQVEQGFLIKSLRRDETTVSFSVPAWSARFEGTISEDGERVSGVFQQGVQKIDLILTRNAEFKDRVLTEAWKGTLVAGPKSFDFQIRIMREGDKEVAVLDSFAENLTGLPLELKREETKFEFKLPISAATYSGLLSDDGKSISGTWNQRGNELPLDFEKIEIEAVRAAGMNRPQQPKQPYPWKETELEFDSTDAAGEAFVLKGTLSVPANVDAPPVVILVNGSGPHDRDCTLFGHQSFVVITDWLTKNGIATLRYDERGVGESGGNYATATSLDLAHDVSVIVDALAKRTDLDAGRIAIMGHSEGGLIAPIVANMNAHVNCIVLLAGPAVNGERIIVSQSREAMKRSGMDAEMLELQDSVASRMIAEVLRADRENEKVDFSAIEDDWTKLMEKAVEVGASAEIPPGGIDTVGAVYQAPWMKYFLAYDPATALRELRVPTLALFGEKDFQVLPELNANAMKEAMDVSGNKDFTMDTIPDLNHLFQTCETGMLDEYGTIEETFSPIALRRVSDWLTRQFEK